jgi:hypothetical protein
VIVTCAFALAACGSGSKGPSRIEYAQRADAICSRYNQQTARLGSGGAGVENLARIADRTLVLLDRATARLRALPIPDAESALAKRWLASLQRLRVDVVKIRDAARANDLARIRSVGTTAQRDNDASNALARRLGMTACSAG